MPEPLTVETHSTQAAAEIPPAMALRSAPSLTQDPMKTPNRKKNDRLAMAPRPEPRCPNCGAIGRHYVVPAMKDPGFFICDPCPLPPPARGENVDVTFMRPKFRFNIHNL